MHLNLIKYFLLSAICATAQLQVKAQTDSIRLSLNELFDRGTEKSLLIAADRLKEQIAYEQTQTARMAYFPDIEVGLRGGFLGQPIVFQNGLSNPTKPDSPDWQQNYAVDFSQPIYMGGKIKYAVKKANLNLEAAQLQTVSHSSDLKLSLLEQYLNLFSLYKQYDMLKRNIEESERRLKDIVRMKEEGIITNNDVLRSEMQLTDNRLALKETENNIILVSQKLDILLGLDENLIISPDRNLLEQEFGINTYTEYIEQAFNNDPTMKLLQKQTEQAQNEIGLARAEKLPKLSLTASNTLARPVSRTLADMYNNNWNIGISLSYSLSTLYKNKNTMNAARQGVVLSRNAEEQFRQEILIKVRQAILKHQEAQARVKALELSVKQAEENYRIMNNRYMNQMAILTDLLDADNLRLNAELQLTTAQTLVIYTYYELQRATGYI